MSDEQTITLYNARASDYRDRNADARRLTYLDRFIAALPENAHVLDLGCGPGDLAAQMVAAGLRVDALDASVEMARLAREAHGLDVRIGTFDDVSGTDIYDGVWAHFSLLHAPREALPRHLMFLGAALKLGGHFLIAMKLGDGAHRDGIGRFYAYYSESELSRLLSEAGFRVDHRYHGKDVGLDGTEHDWIALLCTFI